MASRRIYITLNDQKEKDRIIEAYLSQSYSESDAIKEAIYRLATSSVELLQNNADSTEKVQLVSKSDNKVKKDTKRSSNKKVQKGADNTKKIEKVTNYTEVLNETNSNNEVQQGTSDDINLDLSQFSDEVVEVKADKEGKEELKKEEIESIKAIYVGKSEGCPILGIPQNIVIKIIEYM